MPLNGVGRVKPAANARRPRIAASVSVFASTTLNDTSWALRRNVCSVSHSLTKPLNGGKAAIGNTPTAITAQYTDGV